MNDLMLKLKKCFNLSTPNNMTTLKQFLAELTFVQIKEISRHSKGLLLALEKSNRKDFLDYEVKPPEKELPRCPHCGLNGAELVKMGWIGHWTKKEKVCPKCQYYEGK